MKNPSSAEIVKHKRKRTFIERYGVDHNSKIPEVKQQKIQTSLDHYGTLHPRQTAEVQEKYKQTCLKKYGVENPNQSIKILEKSKKTNLEKYGVEWVCASRFIVEKKVQTCLMRYGVRNYSQHHMIDVIQLLNNQHWLNTEYSINGKSLAKIADDLHIAKSTVLRYLHINNIEIKQQVSYSHQSILWLNSIMERKNIFIRHALNGGEYRIPGTKYKADGYCAETNTIYEFHGDYWHGNPTKYISTDINHVNKRTMGELYQQTLNREQLIISKGYNLITIWESDFYKEII